MIMIMIILIIIVIVLAGRKCLHHWKLCVFSGEDMFLQTEVANQKFLAKRFAKTRHVADFMAEIRSRVAKKVKNCCVFPFRQLQMSFEPTRCDHVLWIMSSPIS